MAGSGADPASSAGAAAPQPPLPPRHPLPFRLLPAAPTAWDPATAEVTLNLRLDGCIVPSEASAEGARISYSHAGRLGRVGWLGLPPLPPHACTAPHRSATLRRLAWGRCRAAVVIDDFIDDATRQQLLDFLLHGDAAGGSGGEAPQPGSSAADAAAGEASGPQLPAERWERRTTDMAGAAPTWGVKRHVLRELAEGRLPAMQVRGLLVAVVVLLARSSCLQGRWCLHACAAAPTELLLNPCRRCRPPCLPAGGARPAAEALSRVRHRAPALGCNTAAAAGSGAGGGGRRGCAAGAAGAAARQPAAGPAAAAR